MKKHLFFAAIVFTTVSLRAQAVVSVAPDTEVKVKESTLFYVKGEMKVADYTNGTDKKISNEGNVRITEKLVNNNVDAQNAPDGANFVNEYVGTGKYGQLIIENNGSTDKASGKITSVVKKPQEGKFAYLPLALPYSGINTEAVVKELFKTAPSNYYNYKGGGAFSDTRYKAPLFFFNNESYTVDDLSKDDNISPTSYYMANTKYTKGIFGAGEKAKLTGVPNNKKEDLILDKYSIAFNTNLNKYGEPYGSYINDWVVENPQDWENYNKASGKVVKVSNTTHYGDNIFQFGNPYTSNIDLSKGFFTNISGKYSVMQRTSTTFNEGVKDGEKPSTIPLSSKEYYNSNGYGSEKALLVRPFQSFQVKMIDEENNYRFSFSDALKTFSLKRDDAVNTMYSREAKHKVMQLELQLLAKDGTFLGKTYIGVDERFKASKKGDPEIYDPDFGDDYLGIYTRQEKEDGSIDESITSKTYLNGININYIAKPIHIVIQNGLGEHILKGILSEDLINSGKFLYIRNTKTMETKKIEPGFTYKINVKGTDKDTYVIYWAELPSDKVIDEDLLSVTKIYRDVDRQYKVRFGDDVKNPSVFVYNISGQLVNVTRNISTGSDYIIPANGNATVYIVKIIGENGKVITKKIIK